MKTSFPLDQLFLTSRANPHDIREFITVDEDDGKMYFDAGKAHNVYVEIIGNDGDIDQIRFIKREEVHDN